MEIVLKECVPMRARITEKQCAINREKKMFVCGYCEGLRELPAGERSLAIPAAPAAVKPAPGKVEFVLRFEEEDAEVMRRFTEVVRTQGGNLAEDVATVVELFMDGRLKLAGGKKK